MREFATLPQDDRADALVVAARGKGMHPAIDGRFPSRYSRHYYDLYKLAHSDVKEKALGDQDLLKSVVDFKMTFWRSNAAHYDLCAPGTMRLMPPDGSISLVEQDYASMQNMIFGEAPSFDELMSEIGRLESEINSFV